MRTQMFNLKMGQVGIEISYLYIVTYILMDKWEHFTTKQSSGMQAALQPCCVPTLTTRTTLYLN